MNYHYYKNYNTKYFSYRKSDQARKDCPCYVRAKVVRVMCRGWIRRRSRVCPGLINESKQRYSSAPAAVMTNSGHSPSATAAKFVSRLLTPRLTRGIPRVAGPSVPLMPRHDGGLFHASHTVQKCIRACMKVVQSAGT